MQKRILMALAATALIGSAQAQTKWDMPTPYADGNFHTKNAHHFAEDVAKATAGKLQIQVHSNASLIKHPEIKRAVQTGQVPIGEVLISVLANEIAALRFRFNSISRQ
jgi:TRAP-type C4-dicarboxylate transport system substrate-binding protein